MAREYFAAYHSYLEAIEPLNDAERGRLFTACLLYSKTGEAQELRGNERFIFPGLKSQIDRDAETYTRKCETNRANGAEGGKTKAKNRSSERYQMVPNGSERNRTPPKEKEKEKKKENKRNSPKESKESASAAACHALSEGLGDALERFKEHRVRLKAPMTDYTVGLTLAKLEKLSGGDEQKKIAILNQSMERGWKGIFALDEDKPRGRPAKTVRDYPQHDLTDSQLDHLLVDLDGPLNEQGQDVEES